MATSNEVRPLSDDISIDTASLIRGMNETAVSRNLNGLDTKVHSVLVVGRTEEAHLDGPVLRVVLVYLHKPTQLLGVLHHDITLTTLRQLEAMGSRP